MLSVTNLMTQPVQCVTPDTTLMDVLSRMNKYNCRHMPVVEGDRLIGIVTDRDVRLAMDSTIVEIDLGRRVELLEKSTVKSIMTPDPVTVTPEMPIYQAAILLRDHQFGALPVVEGERLVGIITVTDFLDYVAVQARPVMSMN